MRKKRWISVVLTCLVAAYLLTIHGWQKLKLRVDKASLATAVHKTNPAVSIVDTVFSLNPTPVRAALIGDTSLPVLVLLHGAPSSLKGWQEIYLDTQFTRKFCLLVIDRPGYGYSSFGEPQLNIATAGSLVNQCIQAFGIRKKVSILGSSYGGPVAIEAVAQQPTNYHKLILLSASVKPEAEKTYAISYAMVQPWLQWLFPTVLVTASKEKLSHAQELAKINDWQNIRCETIIIHGTADDLIYYSNAVFAHKMLSKASPNILVSLPGKGHALIFSKPTYLKRILRIYL
ncbi:MAG: alpha/beta hydrolase [Bacteroidetes bacterium]|nr:MAG: alpha/beta hydrolase [Bacteroidota bacterium]